MIDTHAHLNFAAYKDDFNQVRQNYLQVGISKIINIGTNLETSLESIELSQKFPEIYATIGIHPCDWNKYDAQVEEKFQQILNSPQAEKIVAIGECGIDLFHEEKFLNQQIAVFKAQIKIARQFDLPIIIHARNPKDPKQNPTKSHELALQILQEQNHTKAVFHCFMEELQFAEKLWKQGIYT
jgi:TatD DNase family protein